MTNLWRVVELTADPLKPTQPMDASGMKALTPDRHCISTQPSLHTLLPHLWDHKAVTLPPSLLRTCSSMQPLWRWGRKPHRRGGLLLSSTHIKGEGRCCSHSSQAVSSFPISVHSHLHLQISWCNWNVCPCNNANTVVCISGRSCKRALGHGGRRIKTFHPIRSCEVPRADHW